MSPQIDTVQRNTTTYWDGVYGRAEYPTMDPNNVRRYDAAAARQVGSTALDFGCGQGGLGLSLHRRWPDVHYTGLDFSLTAITGSVLPQNEQHWWQLQCRDWLAGLPPGYCADTVYLLDVLEHADAPHHLLAVAASVARRRLVVTVPKYGILTPDLHRGEHRYDFTDDEFRALLAFYGTVNGPEEANTICNLWWVDRE